MILYYLDASVWVKRYVRERGTGWVEGLFAQRKQLACASLGLVEVTAALARRRRAGQIRRRRFEQKLEQVAQDWAHVVQIDFTPETVSIAAGLARTLTLRGADAVHLASAIVLQQRFPLPADQVTFVCSDHELKAAAIASALQIIDPEEEDR